jgi:hypothetical protein
MPRILAWYGAFCRFCLGQSLCPLFKPNSLLKRQTGTGCGAAPPRGRRRGGGREMKQTEETLKDQGRLATFVPCGLPLVPCCQNSLRTLGRQGLLATILLQRVLTGQYEYCTFTTLRRRKAEKVTITLVFSSRRCGAASEAQWEDLARTCWPLSVLLLSLLTSRDASRPLTRRF